ncbi:MAG: DUF2207 domain-containing protein [Actinophytocola sp.]|uniref:DUF2207 family protein n=1 Tax=Actinophytocola sp. TaxID=1872138 RepID=UPI001323EE80|nr:DUF2207 domain-containing protein [Actinophytocola sp.]MPZ86295.1 DUF2207 domain-containing protein [Actinophytocola sp.]
MLAKWGAALAAAAAVSGAAFLGSVQPTGPSVPAPSPGGPTFEFPAPSGGATPPGTPSISLDPTKPSTPPSGPRPVPLLPQSINIALKVEHDGRLSVTEQVFVQARKTMTRHQPLRIQAGDDTDRVFTVRDVKVDGNGSTEITGDEFVMRLGEGATTVTYTVDGAVVDAGDHQEVRWQVAGGWDVTVRLLRASFVAPDLPSEIVCLAGRRGSEAPCSSALTDHGQVLRVVQEDLPAGERVDLAVTLPSGTVGGNAEFDETTTGAFALTPVSGIGLGALALVLVGGFGLLWLARGRDARALAADYPASAAPVELLVTDGGRVAFASPDGVLPGEVGTVVDEHVDVADVTATVVDLAVRNYLCVRHAGGDWFLVRRNPPDDALTGHERAVWTALLGDAAEVSLTQLRGRRPDLSGVRDELYAGVVRHEWFTRRPDHVRTRWMIAGVLLAVLGGAATAVLALTIGHALLGLAVVIGGLGLALGARFMPARTKRGSVLVQQVRGLLGYLRGTDPAGVPAEDREMVLSRSLPYAVVLGETEGWLARFAGLDTAADGDAGIYWYEGADVVRDFPAFLRELDAVLTASGQLR